MTELGVAAEQVYALESARLRCLADPERDSWKTDVSAWYGRSLCTATLSAYCLSHRGVHGENDRANHSDTEALADAVVNDILKRGGVLPGGL